VSNKPGSYYTSNTPLCNPPKASLVQIENNRSLPDKLMCTWLSYPSGVLSCDSTTCSLVWAVHPLDHVLIYSYYHLGLVCDCHRWFLHRNTMDRFLIDHCKMFAVKKIYYYHFNGWFIHIFWGCLVFFGENVL
jgi:hypothetical protein